MPGRAASHSFPCASFRIRKAFYRAWEAESPQTRCATAVEAFEEIEKHLQCCQDTAKAASAAPEQGTSCAEREILCILSNRKVGLE